MQPVVSYAIVEMDKSRVATVPVATQSSRSSRSSRSSSPKVSSWSIEARLKEKERQIKRTELKSKQAMEEARIRQEEEDRIRRLDEERKREKARVEAEKVQRQLRKELESHQLSSRILQQQLKFEQRSPRSVTPVEASGNLFFQPEVKAAATPVSSVQQQLEVSSVPAKGALAKIKTNSRDEASSLSWSLALLARWEGVDFTIQLIEKKLWPFLQRWSSGEGTNNAAAAVIITIGMIGKTVPASKRAGVNSVLDAMKTILQSEETVPPVQEAAIEAVIHLGETDDPKSIIEIVKSWKIENTYLSQHMRLVLKAFLKRHSDLCVV